MPNVKWPQRRCTVLAAVLLSCAFASSSSAFESLGFRVVALTGQPVPGLPAGVSLAPSQAALFRNIPAVNASGDASFIASLSGVGVDSSNRMAVFSEVNGELRLIARTGNAAPFLPSGVVISQLLQRLPNFSDQGATLFEGVLSGVGVDESNNQGLFLSVDGTTSMIARLGQSVAGFPGGPQYLTRVVGHGKFDAFGQVYFGAGLAAAPAQQFGPSQAVFRYNPSGMETIVSRFDVTPTGSPIKALIDFAVAKNGDVGLSTWLDLPPAQSNRDTQLLRASGSTLQAMAIEGQLAPGFPIAAEFRQPSITTPFAFIGVNERQMLLGTYLLSGEFGGNGLRFSVWTAERDARGFRQRLVAADGQPLSGRPQYLISDIGTAFGTLGLDDVIMNEQGDIAIPAKIHRPGEESQWALLVERAGVLDWIARNGDEAPGLPEGSTFAISDGLREVAMNDRGQIAFLAGFQSPVEGGESEFGSALFLASRDDETRIVVKVGDLIEVASNDFREVEFLQFFVGSSGADGRPRSLNNQGQIAFQASFTDGSQAILVSSGVAVPEPAAWALLVIVLPLAIVVAPRRREAAVAKPRRS